MSTITTPDAIWLLTCRPTCHGTSQSAHEFRVFDSWLGAEVLGWFATEDEASTEMERLVESYNHELFGPPKQALAIAKVELV